MSTNPFDDDWQEPMDCKKKNDRVKFYKDITSIQQTVINRLKLAYDHQHQAMKLLKQQNEALLRDKASSEQEIQALKKKIRELKDPNYVDHDNYFAGYE
jgi:hypothetical protein